MDWLVRVISLGGYTMLICQREIFLQIAKAVFLSEMMGLGNRAFMNQSKASVAIKFMFLPAAKRQVNIWGFSCWGEEDAWFVGI